MSHFGKRFGQLVYQKREEKGWSLAQLAVAVYGDDGVGGDRRKADVQKLEAGQSKKPNTRTIKRYREALELTQEEIDACRTPQELELAQFAEKLFDVIADASRALGLTDDYMAAVADRYAEGNPGNFDGALNGLKAALEAAAQEKARTTNLDVGEFFAQVTALNAAGEIDEADAALEAELAKRRDLREKQKAEDGAILDKAITQAVATRNADLFANRTLEKIKLDEPDLGTQFVELRSMFVERYQTGLRFGAPFALEAAIGLAKRCAEIAPSPYHHAMAQNDRGVALQNQGTRTEGK